jgi:hypothetical protein
MKRTCLLVILVAASLGLAQAPPAQQKPFIQDQVQGLVRSGLGDESGGKLIEQRGIDFARAGPRHNGNSTFRLE